MSILTIEVGAETALFQLQQGATTEQYRILTGERFSISDLNTQIAAFEVDYNLANYKLGIAFPGIVSQNKLISCKHLPLFVGLSASEITTKAVQIYLCNDSHAALYNTMKPTSSCEILITCHESVSMAVAINGQLFKGVEQMAGALGDCRVMTESGEFNVDQLASGHSVKQRRLKNAVELYRAGAYLGMGAAWTINLLNPQQLWLSGSTISNPDYFKGCVNGIKDLVVPSILTNCKISRVDDMKSIVCQGLQKILLAKNDF